MTALQDYVERTHGGDYDAAAVTLSALTGKKIGAAGVRLWSQRAKPPKAWAEALGLSAERQPTVGARDDVHAYADATPLPGDDEAHRQDERPPEAPPGAPLAAPTVGRDFARKRISAGYEMVGAGIASAVENPGVGKVWDDHSLQIADAWIAAAETNEFARKVVAFFTAGGPMGEVVVLHLSLIAGTLYVLGQFPEVGLFGSYRRYRRVAEPEPAETGEDHPDAAANGAGDPLAVPAS